MHCRFNPNLTASLSRSQAVNLSYKRPTNFLLYYNFFLFTYTFSQSFRYIAQLIKNHSIIWKLITANWSHGGCSINHVSHPMGQTSVNPYFLLFLLFVREILEKLQRKVNNIIVFRLYETYYFFQKSFRQSVELIQCWYSLSLPNYWLKVPVRNKNSLISFLHILWSIIYDRLLEIEYPWSVIHDRLSMTDTSYWIYFPDRLFSDQFVLIYLMINVAPRKLAL
jgi:hypothetical protein